MSNSKEISQDLREFILKNLDSVELLNVLLLLQSNSQKTWTISQITTELRSSENSIGKRITDLYARRILNHSESDQDQHRYTPASDSVGKLVQELSEVYLVKPYAVIEIIYSRPNEAVKAFSDAFKFRGES